MYRNVTTILLFHKDCIPYDLEIISLVLFKEIKNIQSPDYYICSSKPSIFPFSPVRSLSRVQLFATPWTAACQASLSITNSWSLLKCMSIWCHPTISSSIVPFSSCLQSFPASGSFPMSQFFTSGGQSIGASASASVPPMNIQDWFSLGWTGWISLLSKGLSRVFSNTTVQKHQFFSTQLSLWSNSHIHTWLLGKPVNNEWINKGKYI